MNKSTLFTVAFIFFSASAFADNDPTNTAFLATVARAGMTFEMPKGLIPTPVFENNQMAYDYAIKYPDKRFEVRYAIRPLEKALNDFKQKQANTSSGMVTIHPNKWYSSLFDAIVLNIAQGIIPERKEFDSASVKAEFNADWGVTTFVVPKTVFAQAYKYCMVLALHKDNIADAYIFFLADSPDVYSTLAEPAFYALKFKKTPIKVEGISIWP
jgi:hypothetical protein